MPRYLLDTNAVSDLINDPRGRVAAAIERVAESALGCTLVTDNEREFSRVKSLRVENWL